MQQRRSSNPPRGPERPALAQALGHSAADRRILILRGIAATGSISQAAREAGVSYKAAWQAVATLTNLAGVPLVERVVGGAGGGGARLTAQGQALLQMAQAYDGARRAVAQPGAAGSAAAGLRVRTSMRNQLPGTVLAVARQGRQALVQIALGEGGAADDALACLQASITQESAELLGLAPGLPLIAMCKATAVRMGAAADAPPAEGAGINRLGGVVAEVFKAARSPGAWADAQGDELTLTLAGSGLALVGFAAPGVALRRRQRAWAELDASAVVLALPG
ncbi:TOBE domain-containing protein [Xenophilus arseniciresistens]|uniref:TOBE domain-containing protein n=1 Tax=Xenophilus arseniciresistens TaxID=1283306 RepID=A0AAE3T041_9BURK|nr:TOBE domain-containing protein [Xenophilus arseniciresistens]MDA7417185.1 TOBE domain-containing protein [Xenophilus arseniciresistens]